MSKDDDSKNVIETASATTSQDNSNSGPFAYIITAVTVILVLLFSLVGGGCTAAILNAAADSAGSQSYTTPYTPHNYDTYNYDDMDWEDWLEYYDQLENNPMSMYNNTNTDKDTKGTATVSEILDFGMAPYGMSLDEQVSASSYAGVPSDARDFVRAFVAKDEEYQTKVVNLLNEAALDESAQGAKIKEALTLCDEASNYYGSLEIPAISGDADGTVKDLLGSAKTSTQNRWKAIHDEIALLDTTEPVNKERFWDLDDEVYDTTEEAATSIEDALDAAARISKS